MRRDTPPRVRLHPDHVRDRMDEALRLTDLGVPAASIAVRLRVTRRTVERYRARGREMAGAQ